MGRDRSDETTVYTDGACRGNPGPGGWAWVVPGGPYASGAEDPTTNQRMELRAVLEALRALEGPLDVASDSTYVVNCFRDRWWEGWRRRGWLNSQRKPVANRDLWEPLVDLVEARGDVLFRWVKGHGTDPWNELADRLAVEAALTGEGRSGDDSSPLLQLAPSVAPEGSRTEPERRIERKEKAKAPLSEGYRVLIGGHQPPQIGGYDPNPVADRVRQRLVEYLNGRRMERDDVVVVTGLRLGAETLGAEAAVEAGVPYVAVLPYPEPDARWPAEARRRFAELLAGASAVVTLDKKPPAHNQAAAMSMNRRDAWMARHADEAVVVWDGEDDRVGRLVRSLRDHLGDDVMVLSP